MTAELPDRIRQTIAALAWGSIDETSRTRTTRGPALEGDDPGTGAPGADAAEPGRDRVEGAVDLTEMLLLDRPRRPVFVISAPPAVRACGRARSVEAFLAWLEAGNGDELGLPGRPIMIELSPKPHLQDGDTGRFVILGRGGWPVNELRVVAAIGRTHGDAPEAWEARLSAIPHELAHVGQWHALHGDQTPWEIASEDAKANRHELPSLAAWRALDVHGSEDASPESIARHLVRRFLDEHPQLARPECAPGCPCRSDRA